MITKRILTKLSLTLFVLLAVCIGVNAVANKTLASETDPACVQTGVGGACFQGVVIVAPAASPIAGTYGSTQSVVLSAAGATSIRYTVDNSTPTCSSGTVYSSAISIATSKTIEAIACYANNNSSSVSNIAYTISVSSGGGGGGLATTYCTAVTYGDWQSACYNGVQLRNTATQNPSGCTLTATQQAEQRRTCTTTTNSNQNTDTTPAGSINPTSGSGTGSNSNSNNPGATVLQNIATESQIVSTNNIDNLMAHLNNTEDQNREQAGLVKYKTILGLDRTINAEEKTTVNDFIVYGTLSTQRLGVGERAGVINSYFQAYHKLPNSEAEWSDLLKIANGRWPSERSVSAENQAKVEFKKVYGRNPVMTNNIDQNAIMIIAYGLLPLQRNVMSEARAILSFRFVYGHAPLNALAWNVVRAIAYSGAHR